MHQSIFHHFWFWITVIGIALILGSALYYTVNKESPTWITVIFWVGVGLSLLGLLIGIILFLMYDCFHYQYNQEKEIKVVTQDFSTPQVQSRIFSPVSSPIGTPYTPIGTPSRTDYNLPQLERGFVPTSSSISSLNPKVSLPSPLPSPYTSLNRMFST